MSFAIRFLDEQPASSDWNVNLPREAREFGQSGQSDADLTPKVPRLCRLPDCSADFAASGGLATGTEVADRLRVTVRQPVSALAHWIVDRQVIAFSCGAELWLPLFQFDFTQGCVRGGVESAISELAAVMTDGELAYWFVQPNSWLRGAVPAETLLTNVAAVLAAARVDRYVAK